MTIVTHQRAFIKELQRCLASKDLRIEVMELERISDQAAFRSATTSPTLGTTSHSHEFPFVVLKDGKTVNLSLDHLKRLLVRAGCSRHNADTDFVQNTDKYYEPSSKKHLNEYGSHANTPTSQPESMSQSVVEICSSEHSRRLHLMDDLKQVLSVSSQCYTLD